MLAPASDQAHALLGKYNSLGGPSCVIVRADVLAAAGGFDERLSAFADWDAWLRVLDVPRGVAVPELLTAYTIHADNMHRRDPLGMLTEFEQFGRIVRNRGGAVAEGAEAYFLRWLAGEASQAGHRRAAATIWWRQGWRTRNPEQLIRAGLALIRDRTQDEAPFAAPDWLGAMVGDGH
jgi:hypothetical protein